MLVWLILSDVFWKEEKICLSFLRPFSRFTLQKLPTVGRDAFYRIHYRKRYRFCIAIVAQTTIYLLQSSIAYKFMHIDTYKCTSISTNTDLSTLRLQNIRVHPHQQNIKSNGTRIYSSSEAGTNTHSQTHSPQLRVLV